MRALLMCRLVGVGTSQGRKVRRPQNEEGHPRRQPVRQKDGVLVKQMSDGNSSDIVFKVVIGILGAVGASGLVGMWTMSQNVVRIEASQVSDREDIKYLSDQIAKHRDISIVNFERLSVMEIQVKSTSDRVRQLERRFDRDSSTK